MKSIKQFIDSYTNTNNTSSTFVNKFLKQSEFMANAQLSFGYSDLLQQAVNACGSPTQFLKTLILRIPQQHTYARIIKLFTVIHRLIHIQSYNQQIIQTLQSITLTNPKVQVKFPWLNQFINVYFAYLAKITTISDLLSAAANNKITVSPQTHLTQIFRILNTVNILFPIVKNTMNIIGRYHQFTFVEIRQLYKVLSQELTLIYNYVKFLKEQILQHYAIHQTSDLRSFIDYIPEIQQATENIQDFLTNKYMREYLYISKSNIEEEKIDQIIYYLDCKEKGTTADTVSSQNEELEEKQQQNNKFIEERALKKSVCTETSFSKDLHQKRTSF